METKVSGNFAEIVNQINDTEENTLTESFKKIYESFNISAAHTADKVAFDFIGMYSNAEIREMSDEDLYESVFEVAMGYVDEGPDYNAEVQEVADIAFDRVKRNPFATMDESVQPDDEEADIFGYGPDDCDFDDELLTESISEDGDIICDECGDILAPDEVAFTKGDTHLCIDCADDSMYETMYEGMYPYERGRDRDIDLDLDRMDREGIVLPDSPSPFLNDSSNDIYGEDD